MDTIPRADLLAGLRNDGGGRVERLRAELGTPVEPQPPPAPVEPPPTDEVPDTPDEEPATPEEGD